MSRNSLVLQNGEHVDICLVAYTDVVVDIILSTKLATRCGLLHNRDAAPGTRNVHRFNLDFYWRFLCNRTFTYNVRRHRSTATIPPVDIGGTRIPNRSLKWLAFLGIINLWTAPFLFRSLLVDGVLPNVPCVDQVHHYWWSISCDVRVLDFKANSFYCCPSPRFCSWRVK